MSSNIKIAKNTIMLYFRIALLILVNLYTSRVILKVLGVEDFGLYSIVGAIVVFLGFINISMASASQRFLSFTLSKGKEQGANVTFNSVFVVQLLISIIILLVGELAGIIYIEFFLNVNPERLVTAHIVYQFSLFAFVTKALSVPYNASIIANEKMDAFAIISIFEGIMQLAIVISLKFVDCCDKLVLYSLFILLSVIIAQLCYYIYCKRKFEECQIKNNWDKNIIKSIFTYSGWNLIGAFSSVVVDQGCNMVLNAFFGVIVNAARGIAFQVSAGISSLSSNFQQALNPPIVKSYAENDLKYMHNLIFVGTRFSFFLLLIIALPIFFNLEFILNTWLGSIPEYSVLFCKLILINSLVSAFSGCLMMGALATGNIKKYQIVVASINMLNLPLSILLLLYWRNPYITAYIMIFLSILSFVARLCITSRLINLSIALFLKDVILKSLSVIVVCIILISIFNYLVSDKNFITYAVRILASGIIAVMSIVAFGVNKKERMIAVNFVKRKILK